MSFGKVSSDLFTFNPVFGDDDKDEINQQNLREVKWKAKLVEINGIEYAFNEDTLELYDLDSYKINNPILVGKLKKQGSKYQFEPLNKVL